MKVFEPKLFTVMKSYSKKQLVSDLVAGLIVAIIALPLSIALAIASGVSPERGLYTAIVAGFVIAFLGGSRVNISGPTAAFATIVAGIVAQHGVTGLALATVMAGIILIIFGICRVGSLIKYIPDSITTGFTSGIAVTIIIGQLKDFLGLTFPEGTHAVETTEKLAAVVKNIGTVNPWALGVGLFGLAILILWPRVSKKIPPSLIAVLAGTAVVLIFKIGANTIGDLYTIEASFPPFALPKISGELILELLPNAFTIAILAAIESLLSCVVSDEMIGDRHNSNTELIAQGAGNIASALFGGIPATGAIARTAANVKNGGRSPVSGMVHSVVLLAVLLVLMPYAAYIPMPIIAAILFIVAYNMSEWRHFVKLVRTETPAEVIVLIATFALTVVFDLVVAIAVGLGIHFAVIIVEKLIKKRRRAKAPDKETAKEEALLAYSSIGKAESAVSYGNGHINDTFLVTTDKGRYILQRINHHVFKAPDEVMNNITGVTAHIARKALEAGKDARRATLTVIPTDKGDSFFRDSGGGYWRVYTYIEGTVVRDAVESIEDFAICGRAFGEFQRQLADYPAHTLAETIKEFHNTPERFENMQKAIERNLAGRRDTAKAEIDFALSREDTAMLLYRAYGNGEIPLRVTHNDTKLNNVLFDAETGEAVAIVDLDTVMPGFSVTDFGDSIRFGANTAAEDETDLSLVSLDLALFRAYAEGFIEGCGGRLTEQELDLLPEGAMVMTYECGMRFLTDYLDGDLYFKVHRDGHNLDRCRTQFALLRDMEAKLPEMRQIINELKK